MNKDSYFIHDTQITFCNNTDRRTRYEIRTHYKHYGLLHRVLNMLRDEGFAIENDPNVERIIRKDYFRGRRGDLEVKAHRFPAGFEIVFFQNLVIVNPNGGEYDFNKFQKMPYLIRLRFMKYRDKIIALLKSLEDLEDKTKAAPRLAEEWIKARYAEEWHHEQKDTNFLLSDLDGQTQPTYNGRDRDDKTLHNGDIKYFRHYNGHLYRGRVYHNINNMWWVILNKYEVRNIAAFELFDLSPEDYRGRQKKPQIPKEYQERRKAIEEAKTKELLNELRRRGVKVG